MNPLFGGDFISLQNLIHLCGFWSGGFILQHRCRNNGAAGAINSNNDRGNFNRICRLIAQTKQDIEHK